MPSSKSSIRGFTLVEALATLVLIAIVLPATMRGISLALSLGGESARRTIATLHAQSKLAELVATGAWEDSSLDGDFTTTPSGDTAAGAESEYAITYKWNVTVEDWLDETVKEMTVQVTWESRGAEREVTLTTLVYTEEV